MQNNVKLIIKIE